MWHPSGRRSRHHRVVSLAVGLLQLAAVTWVPIIHPYFHPHEPPSQVSTLLSNQSQQHQPDPDVETFCLICAAGQELSAAVDNRLPLPDLLSGHSQLHTYAYVALHHAETPTNSARAPPPH
jgi:hypothetical protein